MNHSSSWRGEADRQGLFRRDEATHTASRTAATMRVSTSGRTGTISGAFSEGGRELEGVVTSEDD